MSTNFYFLGPADKHPEEDFEDEDPTYHIGKRYAAGFYCWDCNISLPKGNEKSPFGDFKQVKTCPKCGKEYKDEGWNSAAGRELGFNKSAPVKKTGVATCSGFIWAMTFEDFCANAGEDHTKEVIQDEYGRKYTVDQFNEMMNECPIQDHSSVGTWFS